MAENFKKNIGRLATDRYDFQAHLDGYDDGYQRMLHKAEHIVLDPEIFGSKDVRHAIANIKGWIDSQTDRTDGFYTVGSECNIYDADGYLKTNKTTLDEVLKPIFEDIQKTKLKDVAAKNKRIAKGGIVVIRAGTYLVKRTIDVPPGIILMGEGFGTKIINATNLDLPTDGKVRAGGVPVKSPLQISNIGFYSKPTHDGYVAVKMPSKLTDLGIRDGDSVFIKNTNSLIGNLNGISFDNPFAIKVESTSDGYTFILSGAKYSGTLDIADNSSEYKLIKASSLFSIERDTTRESIDAAIDGEMFIFGRDTVICNMVICDNFIEPTSADAAYKDPQNKYDQVPLIVQRTGSSLVLDKVKLLGRKSASGTTFRAIALRDAAFTLEQKSSALRIYDCSIDGFSSPIDFRGAKGNLDSLLVTNSKIRAYGDGLTNPENNSAIVINDGDATIIGNDFYGRGTSSSFVRLYKLSADKPTQESRAKINIQNNAISSVNSAFRVFSCAPSSIAPSSIEDYVSANISGNVFQDKFEIFDAHTPTDPFLSYYTTIGSGVGGTLNIAPQSKLSTININGDTNIYGKGTVNGDLNVNGVTALSAALNVAGAANLSNTLNVTGTTNLADSLTVQKNIYTKSFLNVDGYAKISGNLSVDSALGVAGSATISSSLTVVGPTSTSNLTANGNVSIGGNLTNSGPSSSATLNLLNVNGDIRAHSNLTVDNNVNVGDTVDVSRNIYLGGYLRKSAPSLEVYTQPDEHTFIHMKFDESEESSGPFVNCGTSSASIPSMDMSGDASTFLNPNPTYLCTTSAGGLFGNSIWCNGGGESGALATRARWIQSPDVPSSRPGSEITVSCWVKLTEWHGQYDATSGLAKSGGRWNTIVLKKYNNNLNDWDSLFPPASLEISTDVYPGAKRGNWFARVALGPNKSTDSFIFVVNGDGYRLTLDTWHLLAFTYNQTSGQLKAYFDGMPAGSAERSSSLSRTISYSDGYYYVGYCPVSSPTFKPFPGFIDDVRIENTVRDDSYISEM